MVNGLMPPFDLGAGGAGVGMPMVGGVGTFPFCSGGGGGGGGGATAMFPFCLGGRSSLTMTSRDIGRTSRRNSRSLSLSLR